MCVAMKVTCHDPALDLHLHQHRPLRIIFLWHCLRYTLASEWLFVSVVLLVCYIDPKVTLHTNVFQPKPITRMD